MICIANLLAIKHLMHIICVQAISPAFTLLVLYCRYITERLNNLPNYSFPMDLATIGAVIRANSSLITVGTKDIMNVSKQAPIWAVLFGIGVFLYFGFHFMEKTKESSFQVSKRVLQLNAHLLSYTVLLYLTFTATTIAILLFQPAVKTFEFNTYEELADDVLA